MQYCNRKTFWLLLLEILWTYVKKLQMAKIEEKILLKILL